MKIATLAGTVFGVGYLRPAPGTWGSLTALPLAFGLHQWGGFPLLAAATVLCTVIGLWAANEMTRDQDDLDPSEFVLDEVGNFLPCMVAWDRHHGIVARLGFRLCPVPPL